MMFILFVKILFVWGLILLIERALSSFQWRNLDKFISRSFFFQVACLGFLGIFSGGMVSYKRNSVRFIEGNSRTKMFSSVLVPSTNFLLLLVCFLLIYLLSWFGFFTEVRFFHEAAWTYWLNENVLMGFFVCYCLGLAIGFFSKKMWLGTLLGLVFLFPFLVSRLAVVGIWLGELAGVWLRTKLTDWTRFLIWQIASLFALGVFQFEMSGMHPIYRFTDVGLVMIFTLALDAIVASVVLHFYYHFFVSDKSL